MDIRYFNKYDLRQYVSDQLSFCKIDKEKSEEITDKIRVETERLFCMALCSRLDLRDVQKILSNYLQMSNCKQSKIY